MFEIWTAVKQNPLCGSRIRRYLYFTVASVMSRDYIQCLAPALQAGIFSDALMHYAHRY